MYFNVDFGGESGARMVFELYDKIVPRTAKNFLELCKRKKYQRSIFHRVIPGFMAQVRFTPLNQRKQKHLLNPVSNVFFFSRTNALARIHREVISRDSMEREVVRFMEASSRTRISR